MGWSDRAFWGEYGGCLFWFAAVFVSLVGGLWLLLEMML